MHIDLAAEKITCEPESRLTGHLNLIRYFAFGNGRSTDTARLARRQRSLQYFTSAQFFAHDFRHAMGLLQVTHIFSGSFPWVLLVIFFITASPKDRSDDKSESVKTPRQCWRLANIARSTSTCDISRLSTKAEEK